MRLQVQDKVQVPGIVWPTSILPPTLPNLRVFYLVYFARSLMYKRVVYCVCSPRKVMRDHNKRTFTGLNPEWFYRTPLSTH